MLIVNFQQKAALNFDHITLMNVNKNKLILRYNDKHVAEFSYGTHDDAVIVFNEILKAFVADKKIFNCNPERPQT